MRAAYHPLEDLIGVTYKKVATPPPVIDIIMS